MKPAAPLRENFSVLAASEAARNGKMLDSGYNQNAIETIQ